MSEKGKILAVDDTSESLTLLTDTLAGEGYEVRVADSGELALAAAATQQPDLILMDIRITGMDGLEVCRRLKALPETQRIPIILFSAFADVNEWVEGLGLGAVDYIPKPFKPAELLARIRTHMALSRANALLEQNASTLRQGNEQLRSEIAERERAEEALRLQAKELSAQNEVLVRLLHASTGREMSMIDLKREINELCRRAGEPPRYDLDFAEPKAGPLS